MRNSFEGSSIHTTPERKLGITEDSNTSYASLDGKHAVAIDSELGSNIALALRVQEKVDEALIAGHRPAFLRTISMLNCRKTVSAVRGTVPLRELVSQKKLKQESVSREDLDEVSGLPELWKDIGTILESGRAPVLGSSEDMHIDSYLDEHPNDVPAEVHVFDILPKYEQELLAKLLGSSENLSVEDCKQKMSRNHSFLVLGKDDSGKYVCFQKQGPEVHHKFELRELQSLIDLSVAPREDRLHLSFIGPINTSVEHPAKAPEEPRAILDLTHESLL